MYFHLEIQFELQVSCAASNVFGDDKNIICFVALQVVKRAPLVFNVDKRLNESQATARAMYTLFVCTHQRVRRSALVMVVVMKEEGRRKRVRKKSRAIFDLDYQSRNRIALR